MRSRRRSSACWVAMLSRATGVTGLPASSSSPAWRSSATRLWRNPVTPYADAFSDSSSRSMRSWNALRRSASVEYDSIIAISRRMRAAADSARARSSIASASAAARSAGVNAAATSPVRRPLAELNSVRDVPATSGGSASPQTLRPASFQQYSFFGPAVAAFLRLSCAATFPLANASAMATTSRRVVFFIVTGMVAAPVLQVRPAMAPSGRGSAAVARAVGEQGVAMVHKVGAFARERKQVRERGDGDDRQVVFGGDGLRGGLRVLLARALLAVERDGDAGGHAADVADDAEGFADRGTGGDHVVDDQHALARERRADQQPTLAVCLGFLAVEGERQVAAAARVFAGQGRGEGDALVRRAEQDVEADARFVDGIGVARRQLGQRSAAVEAAGVEEIRAFAAGLQRECAEAQGLRAEGEGEEAGAMVGHGAFFGGDCAE